MMIGLVLAVAGHSVDDGGVTNLGWGFLILAAIVGTEFFFRIILAEGSVARYTARISARQR